MTILESESWNESDIQNKTHLKRLHTNIWGTCFDISNMATSQLLVSFSYSFSTGKTDSRYSSKNLLARFPEEELGWLCSS
jgi:hypothetical protein